MLESFNGEAMIVGAIGAALHEAARWVGLRQQSRLPAYFYRLHYWLLSAALVLIGGVLAAMLDARTVMQAFTIGIAAPAILSRLGSTVPKEPTLGNEDAKASAAPAAPEDDFHAWLRG